MDTTLRFFLPALTFTSSDPDAVERLRLALADLGARGVEMQRITVRAEPALDTHREMVLRLPKDAKDAFVLQDGEWSRGLTAPEVALVKQHGLVVRVEVTGCSSAVPKPTKVEMLRHAANFGFDQAALVTTDAWHPPHHLDNTAERYWLHLLVPKSLPVQLKPAAQAAQAE